MAQAVLRPAPAPPTVDLTPTEARVVVVASILAGLLVVIAAGMPVVSHLTRPAAATGALAVGQCLDQVPAGYDSTLVPTDGSGRMSAPCAQPHWGQVVGVFEVGAGAAGSYPTAAEVAQRATSACATDFELELGHVWRTNDDLALGWVVPQSSVWSAGHRAGYCVVSAADGETLLDAPVA